MARIIVNVRASASHKKRYEVKRYYEELGGGSFLVEGQISWRKRERNESASLIH